MRRVNGTRVPRRGRLPAVAIAALIVTCVWLPALPAQQEIEPQIIGVSPTPGAVCLVARGAAAAIVVDSRDYAGVRRAAADLQEDTFRVSSVRPRLVTDEVPRIPDVVIVGTLDRSRLIQKLAGSRRLDIGRIRNRWEATVVQVVPRPWPGVERALVIAGSDQRGAIFGLYTISEQTRRLAVALVGGRPRAPPRSTLRARRPVRVGRAGGPLPRALHQRRGARAQRLGARDVRRLQPPLLRQGVRAAAPAESQLPLARDVGQRVCRRRPAHPGAGNRVRCRDRHVAPRTDDAGARRVAALRQGPVELLDQCRGAARLLDGGNPANGGAGDRHHPGHARRRRRADVEGSQHRTARADRRGPARHHWPAPRPRRAGGAAGVGAVQGGAGVLREGDARPRRRDPAVVGRQLGQHPASADRR